MTTTERELIYDADGVRTIPTERLREIADEADSRCVNCGGYPAAVVKWMDTADDNDGRCHCIEEFGRRDYAPAWRLAELELERRERVASIAARYAGERSADGRDAIMQEHTEAGGDVAELIREQGDVDRYNTNAPVDPTSSDETQLMAAWREYVEGVRA